MRFETTQLSDARWEHESLRFITVKTANLKGRGDIVVAVPPTTSRSNLPVMVLLHGVYGSCWAWSMRGGAAETLLRLMRSGQIPPMLLAMPSDGLWGDGSFYLPHHGRDFEKWIVDDVIDAVRLLIPEAAESDCTCLAGLSMGGFGALRLGAKYADRFAAVSAHSAITHLDQARHFTSEKLEGVTEVDQSVLLTMVEHRESLVPFRFDCGGDDLLIEYNRQLHRQLIDREISHVYQEFSGAHEWAYWQRHLEDSLLFFAQYV